MKIAVIGLGYVGLPLSLLLSKRNQQVLAIDINNDKIKNLAKGILTFAKDEPQLATSLKEAISRKNIHFQTDFQNINKYKIILVAVDTPVKNNVPDYESLISVIKSLSKKISRGTTIIIESTVAPLTTINVVIPLLKKHGNLIVNIDYYLAVVPERIRPNHIFEQLTTLSRVIGTSSLVIQTRMKVLYKNITKGNLDFTDLVTAETVKAVENTYRDVNIAFANQVAIACELLGVDVWLLREFVNKSPFHNLHKPGAGVGGHCIPKDPWLLMSSVRESDLSLAKIARQVNDIMPKHMLDLTITALKEKKLNKNRVTVCVLGYSYTEDSDDTRNSPTETLVRLLEKENIKYNLQDPYVQGLDKDVLESIKGADCLILMVGHSKYRRLTLRTMSKLMRHKILIDGRNFYKKQEAKKYGFIYKGIGNT